MSSAKRKDETSKTLALLERDQAISALNHIHTPIVREFRIVVNKPPALTTITQAVEGILESFRYVVTVSPISGKWKNGYFRFQISIPRYYKPGIPTVTCLNPEDIYHPNISKDGKMGLWRIDSYRNWQRNDPQHTLPKLTEDIRDLFVDINPLNKVYNKEAQELFGEKPRVTRKRHPKSEPDENCCRYVN